MEASASDKRTLLEARLGLPVTGWALSAGAMYVAPCSFAFDGISRDVVGVRTILDQGLIRAQSQSDCQSTAGTYYFDPDTVTGAGRWDDLVSRFDDGVFQYDQFTSLFVHLFDNSDPSQTVVEALLGFYYSDLGAWHPDLGVDEMVDGGIETWSNPTSPTNWTAVGSQMPAEQEADFVYSGRYAVRYVANGGVASPSSSLQQTRKVKDGRLYRFCGFYETDPDNSATFAPSLRVTVDPAGTPAVMDPDGRSVNSGAPLTLLPTGGEWRAWCFDYRAPKDGDALVEVVASGTSSPIGKIRFDDVSHHRIWRINFWEPRLLQGAIPSSGAATQDVFFGGKEVGLGQLGLNNADGSIERLLGRTDAINKELVLYVGGALPDGDEILLNDFRRRFTGLIQRVTADDLRVQFELEDIRTLLNQTFPFPPYSLEKYPGMDLSFVGKPKPLWFGARTNITPVGISKDGTTGYRTYELADTSKAPNGIVSIDGIWAYEDEDAAGKKDSARRIPVNSYFSIGAGIDTQSGTASSNDHTTKTAATSAWDSGAYSSTVKIASSEDAYAEGTNGAGTLSWMLGLALSNPDWSYTSLDYALYANSGGSRYEIFELGVQKAILTTPYSQFDRMRVWMRNGVVTYWVNGVLVYTSLVAASGNYFVRTTFFNQFARVNGLRIYRSTNGYHTADLAHGRFTIANDPGPYRVVAGQNKIDFNSGGAAVAVVQPGLYSGQELALQAGAAMAAVANSQSFVGAYSESTHLITFTTPAGVTLQVSSGANKGLWTLLGFTGADRAAAASHVGDTPLFVDPDKDHVLRADGIGFKDDAAGTFTGLGSTAIFLGPDICKLLWNRYLGQPLSSVDVVSFVAARVSAPAILALYLDEATTLRDVFTSLEYSNLANINIDGAGMIFFEPYTNDVPASVPRLFDRDLLSFQSVESYQDIYGTVNVYYDEDPTLGTAARLVRTVTDPNAEGRWNRPNPRDFKTYLTAGADAIQRSNNFLALAKAWPRYVITVKGKLLDSRVGTKTVITRARALSDSGVLVDQVFRILSVTNDALAARTTAEVVQDVPLS